MNKAIKLWKELRVLLDFALLVFVFRSAAADWYDIATGSMKPAIIGGDRIHSAWIGS